MGGWLSSMFGGWWYGETLPPLDDVRKDPTTGLTQKQIYLIRSSWSLVKPDLKKHGINFFILLFQTHPHLQTKFKPFNGKDLETLRTSGRLAAHGTTVMSAFNTFVDNLEDVSCLVEMLKATAINHKNRGVLKNDFELLPGVLLTYFRMNLGSKWTKDTEESWTLVLKDPEGMSALKVTVISSVYTRQLKRATYLKMGFLNFTCPFSEDFENKHSL